MILKSALHPGLPSAIALPSPAPQAVLPQLTDTGIEPIARLLSEESPNNFPRLPIREHERVFIWFAHWASTSAEDAFVAHFAGLSGWRDTAPESVLPALTASALSLPRISSRENPFESATSGLTSRRGELAGNRRSRRTGALPGRRTGSWS
jgi:hypothetical protein